MREREGGRELRAERESIAAAVEYFAVDDNDPGVAYIVFPLSVYMYILIHVFCIFFPPLVLLFLFIYVARIPQLE